MIPHPPTAPVEFSKKNSDLFCPSTLCVPHLKSSFHCITYHFIKLWHVRLGVANNMHSLSSVVQTEMIRINGGNKLIQNMLSQFSKVSRKKIFPLQSGLNTLRGLSAFEEAHGLNSCLDLMELLLCPQQVIHDLLQSTCLCILVLLNKIVKIVSGG